jgi:predicted CoA-binding protein
MGVKESDEAVRNLLMSAHTIAVVGLSSTPFRASFGVSQYMQQQGYKIVPVNPNETEVLGERSLASLDEIDAPVDIVNVFRRPEFVPEIVEAAICNGARCVWMQESVVHNAAAERARDAGLLVVMDRCIYREHRRLVR